MNLLKEKFLLRGGIYVNVCTKFPSDLSKVNALVLFLMSFTAYDRLCSYLHLLAYAVAKFSCN